jgi:hypothetical protein
VRLLRIGSVVLIVGGVIVHLWLGTKVALGVAVVGLLLHGVAIVLGRRWLRARETSVVRQ